MKVLSSYAPVALLPLVAAAVAACSHASPTHSAEDVSEPVASGPQPSFGPLVQQKEPPPPISGGTLAMATDRRIAVVADTDRDRVYIVDVPARAVRHTVALPRHSEPGRVTVDDEGHAFVVLRGAGGIATIDIASGAVSIRDVCIAPRGVGFDGKQGELHVACANGELVTLSKTGEEQKRVVLERDLRDVVVHANGDVFATTFRSASSIKLQMNPMTFRRSDGATLAWRAVAAPPETSNSSESCSEASCKESMAIVVQEPTPDPVAPAPGGYGAGSSFTDSKCESSGIITTKVKLGSGSARLPRAVLPVDLATNGRELAVIAAGNAFTEGLPQIFVVFAAAVRTSFDGCVATVHGNVPGQAVAAAFDADDALLVQTREPAALHIMTEDRRRPYKTITLATDSVADTGHAIFHSNAGGSIACASCHAEGADDGHVWTFSGMGPRRTPSLLGTVKGTEPFHWDGDMKNMRDIVDHVFVERMSGPKVDDGQLEALSGWMFELPAPPKLRAESEATVRGAALFQKRCSSCHSGDKLTNNRSFDVGTGGAFQVPSLVGVGWRTSLLHTGCAQSLTERFDSRCGGGNAHGDTEDLNGAQIEDLIQFLETR